LKQSYAFDPIVVLGSSTPPLRQLDELAMCTFYSSYSFFSQCIR
jgi:hypothetical protein